MTARARCRSFFGVMVLVPACGGPPVPADAVSLTRASAATDASQTERSKPDGKLRQCQDPEQDPFFLNELRTEGDQLLLSVSYSGGCEEHDFTLCWDGSLVVSEESPEAVLAELRLIHDAPDEFCEEFITQGLVLGIMPVKKAFRKVFDTRSGVVTLLLADQSAEYSFE